jgi:hypothetical protein
MAIWRVISAKREATRQKRLEVLIVDSEAGRRTGTVSPQTTAGSGTKM